MKPPKSREQLYALRMAIDAQRTAYVHALAGHEPAIANTISATIHKLEMAIQEG